ncbi:M3 family metallopeptidase [Leptothoe sp. PORK10 BA2]|uniref:M3 family metallopeptidase n=1 Tax=Leptothoe sp. PORK10 BA2 TaxID=3110254 RepID=UPI002B20C103|nr:M3 family metallopeptidase [Leptothoe sp. PORK10 BA2]MEA5464486.1 M3 family metallopeptidase [Leptothoe sp. PORK10 BA2]
MTSTATTSAPAATNPFLIGHGLPPFDRFQPDQAESAVTQLISDLTAALESLEKTMTPTWEGLADPLTKISERLGWTWGILGHLMGVKNSPELRTAYDAVQPALVEFSTRLSQSKAFYNGFKQLASDPGLSPAQRRIVEAAIRDAELSGVGLEGEAKQQFNQIQQQLAELSTQFSNHVLDATKAFSLTLTSPADIAGLPPSLLSLAAQAARDAGEAEATAELGPWRITLDIPSYGPFLKHSQRRDLREKLYRAYVSRASAGDLDNSPLIDQTLALRKQQAQLLGFDTYADLSLARKMAPSVAAVETLMEELRSASFDTAVKELADLKAFAQGQNAPEAADLKQWDISFWAERMREKEFDLNDEELRPYFPLPRVLDGLFGLATRLFGVTITAADGQAPVWHSDVRYFAIADASGNPMAYFYLDPYSRPAEKRGGAWMDECVVRAHMDADQPARLPVAYLVCNQSPPMDGKPSLMTFGEVETLFHEFGHGLQHMLTQVDYPGAAGINNVEWDAVELPSQFMENWCYDRSTLFKMARHYETGAPLPEADYQKLLATRNFMTGNAILRQVNFGWLDIELHSRYQPGGDETIWDVRDRLAKKTTVLTPLAEDAFLCSFGHIFAGGYAAGYYSYFWAEVLSADAFAAFEEVGIDNEPAVQATGQRFRDTVLALGGSRHPMEVFEAFRGRGPSTDALLQHRGLKAA